MEGGPEYKDCFQTSLFQPALTVPFLLRILGLPQTMKSRHSLLWQGPPDRFAPTSPTVPASRALRFSGQDSVAERGDRPGRGDLGVREVADLGLSDEAAPLTSHVISFLCVSVVTPLPKFPEWELQKRSLATGKRLFLTCVSLVESWELDHQMSDH